MGKCSTCGRKGDLDPFIKVCHPCSNLYFELGDIIKKSKENDKLDTLKKMIVSLFADAEIYISIDGE